MNKELFDKIKKNSKIKDLSVLSESKYYTKKDMITTEIPAINVALSGRLDGGLTPGLTLWCGPSKHFKSLFSLILAKAYMDKYPEALMIFYDCEFGMPEAYFKNLDIDMERVVHIPIMNMEEFKFDVISQLEGLVRGDRVIFIVDSVGNMASKKESEDAIEGKSVQDMSRAKQMKSIFRMVTPYLNKLDIPMVAVNHIYMEQGLYPKAIVSGGCVVEGTKIKMSDGSLLNVEDINIGMRVVTMNGDNKVIRTWTPDTLDNGNPECFEISFDDGSSVICSETHEFLIDGQWIEAKDLSVGMDCMTL